MRRRSPEQDNKYMFPRSAAHASPYLGHRRRGPRRRLCMQATCCVTGMVIRCAASRHPQVSPVIVAGSLQQLREHMCGCLCMLNSA